MFVYIYNKLKERFRKYDIAIDSGMFKIEAVPPRQRPGKLVTLCRISEIPINMCRPEIMIIYNDIRTYAQCTEYEREWVFRMPEANVRIIPIIRRRN